MATAQASSSTDVQPRPVTFYDVTSIGTPSSQSPIEQISRPSAASSSHNQTTSQPAPEVHGQPSKAIHIGAKLILEIIKAERKQAYEDAQRQVALLQQPNERPLHLRDFSSAPTKHCDTEDAVTQFLNERDRHLKEINDAQSIASQARADATSARGEAHEAVKAADHARRELLAVRDALQRAGITVNQSDAETPSIILGAPWLELTSLQTHSPDTPILDSNASHPRGAPNSSLPTHRLSSPLDFTSFLKEHINSLVTALHTAQDGCKNLDSQCSQLQSDLRILNFDRTDLDNLKGELEENTKKLGERELRLTELENGMHLLKKEQEDLVRSKEEAVAALQETKKIMVESVNTLKSSLNRRLQDQERHAEAKAERDRQVMKSSMEATIHDLQNQLAENIATLAEWKSKCDAIKKEHDSQQQLHIAELQTQEEIFGRIGSQINEQIEDLQTRLEVSPSKALTPDGTIKDKGSQIEQFEKKVAILRELLSSFSKERQSKQIHQKSTSSLAPGSSISCPLDIDSVSVGAEITVTQRDAESSDIEIVSGPVPITPQGAAANSKLPRTVSRKSASKGPGKTSLKRASDVNDSSSKVTKRPKLSINASGTPLKDKDLSATSNLSALTPLGSRSPSPSPVFLKPGMVPSRVPTRPAQTSNAASLGNDNPPAPTHIKSKTTPRSESTDVVFRLHQTRFTQPNNSTPSGSGVATKKAIVPSAGSHTPQSATPINPASAGAGGAMEDDTHDGLRSASETRNELPKRSAISHAPVRRRLRIQELKGGQGEVSVPTIGGVMNPTKFRNFIRSDVTAKNDPPVHTTTQQRGVASPDISSRDRETRSSSSKNAQASSIRNGDHLSAPSSATLPPPPHNPPPKDTLQAGSSSIQPPMNRPTSTGLKSLTAPTQVKQKPPHPASRGGCSSMMYQPIAAPRRSKSRRTRPKTRAP